MNKFNGHILVVDDDDGIRDLVKQYLTENNFLMKSFQLKKKEFIKLYFTQLPKKFCSLIMS